MMGSGRELVAKVQLHLFEKRRKERETQSKKSVKKRKKGWAREGEEEEVVVGMEGGGASVCGGGALYTGGIFQSSADLKPLGGSFDFNLGCFFENYD